MIDLGTFYTLFAEARIDGKWRGINFYRMTFDGRAAIVPLMTGTSSFGMTLSEAELDEHLKPEDLSDEVKGVESWLFKSSGDDPFDRAYHENACSAIYGRDLANINLKIPERAGWVPLEDILNFESGKTDFIDHYLSTDDFAKLDPDVRQSYRYYQWTNEDSCIAALREIKECLISRIRAVNESNEKLGDNTYVDIGIHETRVVIIRS